MKILLVRPAPDPETIGLQHVMLVEPMELEILAGLAAPGDRPVILDMVLERKPFEYFLNLHQPDVLCVTGYITNVPEMIALCRTAKRILPSVKTIAGGVHVEVCPEDLDDPAVDFRVVRNAVTVFPLLLDHLKGSGDLPPAVFRPGERVEPHTLPEFDFAYSRPLRNLTDRYRKEYFYIFHHRVALIKTSFGCPYKCTFCFCRRITDDKYHVRPMDEVLDELQDIREREIYIVDDDFLCSRNRVEAFIDGCIRRKIRKHFLLYGRADFIAANPDIMKRFRKIGLRTVIVGFESFSDEELKEYDKGITSAVNKEAMSILNRLSICCYATIILPARWSRAEFDECGRRFRELGIRFVNLQPITPLPGTGFEADKDSLVIDKKDFPKWDLAHVTVRPEKMSVADYYGEILRLYMKTLFRPAMLPGYFKYPPHRLVKMLVGSFRVTRQYEQKKRDARHA